LGGSGRKYQKATVFSLFVFDDQIEGKVDVAPKGEIRNGHIISFGTSDKNKPFGRHNRIWEEKIILQKWNVRMRTVFVRHRMATSGGHV
jgi:hypothetical protein